MYNSGIRILHILPGRTWFCRFYLSDPDYLDADPDPAHFMGMVISDNRIQESLRHIAKTVQQEKVIFFSYLQITFPLLLAI